MITAKRAVAIAADWYDGDISALYMLACHRNGNFDRLTREDWKRASEEVHKEAVAAFDEMRYKDNTTLEALERFCDRRLKLSMLLPARMVKDYEKRAEAERKAGTTIEINRSLPYVAINRQDGAEYFFQGEEASELLDSVPDNINEENFILAISQDW